MSSSEPSVGAPPPPDSQTIASRLRSERRRIGFAAALLGAFVVGGGVTAALQARRPALVMLPPAPIAAMHEGSAVAVNGQVADVFGNKFVVQDPSGRALVETGRAGEGGGLVAKDETVTVQGRFEHGFIHAQAIAHADGRNDLVGPPGPPPGGPLADRGPGRPRGPVGP